MKDRTETASDYPAKTLVIVALRAGERGIELFSEQSPNMSQTDAEGAAAKLHQFADGLTGYPEK